MVRFWKISFDCVNAGHDSQRSEEILKSRIESFRLENVHLLNWNSTLELKIINHKTLRYGFSWYRWISRLNETVFLCLPRLKLRQTSESIQPWTFYCEKFRPELILWSRSVQRNIWRWSIKTWNIFVHEISSLASLDFSNNLLNFQPLLTVSPDNDW